MKRAAIKPIKRFPNNGTMICHGVAKRSDLIQLEGHGEEKLGSFIR